MKIDTTTQSFFEQKYREDPDPWEFASNAYEQHRYEVIARALSYRRYQRAFEPGCSIGMLTARLALLCDHVDAMDISLTAVEQARRHCWALPNVEIECGTLPDSMPEGSFDLIVMSEIGYYFDEERLLTLGAELVERTDRHGVLLAAHWLGVSEDHLLSGDQVHETIKTLAGLKHEYSESHAGFRLDRWVRV